MRCFHCMKGLKNEARFCPFCGKKPCEANPPHHLKAGTVLHGRYLIGNAIGEGGFGITYVGLDQTLRLKVAVKEYFPSGYANRSHSVSNDVTLNYTNKADFYRHGKENFLREARNIAAFSKEHGIVDVRDFFEENNTAYIVMEFLDGDTLGKYVRENGAFSAEKLIQLMLPLMRALERMHAQNVIHRDIAPDNIMLLDDGSLKLTDFGAARYFSGEESQSLSVVLKPGYAPYEQYSREGHQGPWSDVYALCATIYQCITGVTPPDSIDRSMGKPLKAPSSLGVAISPTLEAALLKGLALLPKDRWQSMGELQTAVKAALSAKAAATNTTPVNPERHAAADIDKTQDANAGTVNFILVDMNKTQKADDAYDSSSETPNWRRVAQSDKSDREHKAAPPEKMADSSSSGDTGGQHTSGTQKKSSFDIGLFFKRAFILLAGFAVFVPIYMNVKGCLFKKKTYSVAQFDAAAKAAGTFACDEKAFYCIDDSGTAHRYALDFNKGTVKDDTAQLRDNTNLIKLSMDNLSDDVFGITSDHRAVYIYGNTYAAYTSEISAWTGIQDITSYDNHIIGLKTNGTAVTAGTNENEGMTPLAVDGWTDLKSIKTGLSTFGLKKNGTVVTTESDIQLSDIAALPTGNDDVDYFLKKDGTLVDIYGKQAGKNTSDAVYASIKDWKDLVSVSVSQHWEANGESFSYSTAYIGLKKNGIVVAAGANRYGECNVAKWTDIQAVITNGYYTVGKKKDGTYVIATDNHKLEEAFGNAVNGNRL